jgi:hypothetical protein
MKAVGDIGEKEVKGLMNRLVRDEKDEVTYYNFIDELLPRLN